MGDLLGGVVAQGQSADRVVQRIRSGRGHRDARRRNRFLDTAQGDLGPAESHPPARQVLHDGGGGERLSRRRLVAQARRDVHRVPDVVVALHEDDLARSQARADGDGLDRARDHAHDVVDLEDRLEQRPGRDAHEHDPVTQPFGDPHPTPRADVAEQRTEGGEHVDRALVALELGQRREARHVDEGEAAMDAHDTMLPCRSPALPIGATLIGGAGRPTMAHDLRRSTGPRTDRTDRSSPDQGRAEWASSRARWC